MYIEFEVDGARTRVSLSLLKLKVARGELEAGAVRVHLALTDRWYSAAELGLRHMSKDDARVYSSFWVLNFLFAARQAHYAFVNGSALAEGSPPPPRDLAPIQQDLDRLIAWLTPLIRDRRAALLLGDPSYKAQCDELRALASRLRQEAGAWPELFASAARDNLESCVNSRNVSLRQAAALSAATYAREHVVRGEYSFACTWEPVECVHVWATFTRQAEAASRNANHHIRAILSDRSWHPELHVEVYQPLMEDSRALAAELEGLKPEFDTLAALLA